LLKKKKCGYNFKFILTRSYYKKYNKINFFQCYLIECLIAPCFALAKIFQLQGYKLYGMHASIENAQIDFHLAQKSFTTNAIYDDSSNFILLK